MLTRVNKDSEGCVQTPQPQLSLTADARLVQGRAESPQRRDHQQGAQILRFVRGQRQRQEDHQQHRMHSSTHRQTQPAWEAQEAKGEGGKDGGGEAIDDYKEPQFFQAQNADAI